LQRRIDSLRHRAQLVGDARSSGRPESAPEAQGRRREHPCAPPIPQGGQAKQPRALPVAKGQQSEETRAPLSAKRREAKQSCALPMTERRDRENPRSAAEAQSVGHANASPDVGRFLAVFFVVVVLVIVLEIVPEIVLVKAGELERLVALVALVFAKAEQFRALVVVFFFSALGVAQIQLSAFVLESHQVGRILFQHGVHRTLPFSDETA
jgi:hypothetical protein